MHAAWQLLGLGGRLNAHPRTRLTPAPLILPRAQTQLNIFKNQYQGMLINVYFQCTLVPIDAFQSECQMFAKIYTLDIYIGKRSDLT